MEEKKVRNLRFLSLWLVVLGLLPTSSFAQVATGAILGTVRDPSGVAIPGATVTVTHIQTGVVTHAISDKRGAFVAEALPAGTYTVAVDLAGFQSASKEDVEVRGSDRIQVDFDFEFVATGSLVVVGTMASYVKSLDDKREATVVLDTISAEDLGRFPDANVADSLSHVTGITITRTHGGEGRSVSVRGLGPEYSIVTLNNRILATDDDGRDFTFDVLPSEVISGAEVFKSPEASAIEGSIGGAINLRSDRPLDRPGTHFFATAQGDYNDLSEETGYKLSAMLSATFADDTMGLLLGVVTSQGDERSDGLAEMFFTPELPGEIDANGDGSITADEQDLIAPCCTSVGAWLQEKARDAFSATFQWRPSSKFGLTIDTLVTQLDATARGHFSSNYVEWTEGRWDDIVIDDHVITSMTVHDLIPELSMITQSRDVDTEQYGANLAWDVTDDLHLAGDIYRSKSERLSGGEDSWVVAGVPGSHTGYFSLNPNGLPNVRVVLEDGTTDLTHLDDESYGPHWAGLEGADIRDQVDGLSLDGKWSLNGNVVRDLRFGAALTAREKSRADYNNYDHACDYCGYPFTFASIGADVVRPGAVTGVFPGVSGDFPRTIGAFDLEAYFAALNDPNLEPVFNPINSYGIEEETLAAYAQLDFEAKRWFGNLGLRWIDTSTTANGAQNYLTSITATGPAATDGYLVEATDPEATQDLAGYSKVLPSLNLGYKLRYDLILRLAAAEVIARPSLNQLAPITDIVSVYDGDFRIFVYGDADLKPIEATQADLSLEYYYTGRSAVTGAVFYKDIENFITTTTESGPLPGCEFFAWDPATGAPSTTAGPCEMLVERPINGDTAEILGLELGWQQLWENGFGVIANYTHTDSTAIVDGEDVGQLEGVPQAMYSLTLVYEKHRWNLQISDVYTGEYTSTTFSSIGTPETTDDIHWITASAAYNFGENFRLTLEGTNLGDDYMTSYLGRRDLVTGYEIWGRTYLLSLDVRF
jgi:TonB-dependent receptor